MPKLQFWYDFGSSYSYLTAMRIENLAKTSGVDIDWRPFLLGPIFKAAGFESSPFLEQPQKLAYMWRDIERISDARGDLFAKPDLFPANGVYAARIALVAVKAGWEAAWTERVFVAAFEQGWDISKPSALEGMCNDVYQDFDDVGPAAQAQVIKDQLRAQTEDAQRLGIFGAPTFITEDGELFWGDDRLEAALSWAVKT